MVLVEVRRKSTTVLTRAECMVNGSSDYDLDHFQLFVRGPCLRICSDGMWRSECGGGGVLGTSEDSGCSEGMVRNVILD